MRFESLAYMGLAGSATASVILSNDVPLTGPSFLPNFDISKTDFLNEAKEKFPSLAEELFDTKILNKTDLIFVVDVFSASTNDSLYSYFHVGDTYKDTLTKGNLTEDTIFRTGSVTKVFTVYAIIAKAGIEALSYPVSIFLPELLGNSSSNPLERIDWSEITVGALASHQAGTSGPGQYLKPDTDGNDRKAFLEFMRDTQVPTMGPWRSALYSDAGFGVLTLILERLTGQEYKDAIKDIVFGPLGMNSSSAVVPNGTDVDAVARTGLVSWGIDVPIVAGSGGIYSSAKDLRLAGLSILNSDLLSSSTTREWMKPRSSTGTLVELVGAPWEITRLTLPTGPGSNRTRVSDLYLKAGGTNDYTCFIALSPDHGLGFSILIAGETATPARWPLRDVTGTTFITAAEYAAAESADKNLTGTFVVKGSETTNMTIVVTKGEPGLKLKSWYVNGEDVVEDTSSRLYPMGLYSNSRSLAAQYNIKGTFSAAFRVVTGLAPPAPRAAVEGGKGGLFDHSQAWMNIGASGTADELIFNMEDSVSMVPAIESPKDRISAAAAEGERLLSVIAATEDTAATLTQVKLDLAALKNIWYDADALYSELSARLGTEQKEFEDLRDSHIKKFFAGSQYKEKLTKEENDVIELLEWQAKADKTRKELKAKLDDMKERRQRLEHMIEQRVQALNEVDNLYAVVFDGPSPDNAEEDMLEAEMKAAQQILDPIQNRYSQVASVVDYITMARSRVTFAAGSAAKALKISVSDIFDLKPGAGIRANRHFNSAVADRKEREELGLVRLSLAEASQFLALAHGRDPEVGGFIMPKVADGKGAIGRLDDWINTPVTDYLFHREIRATAEGIAAAGAIVDEELRKAEDKKRVWTEKRDAAGKDLNQARGKLQQLRARIFEDAVNGQGSSAAPSYEQATVNEHPPQYRESEP
ncbi:Penicillin-binding 4 [Fusarium agapanthi]|uniref:Penicillin-binding 4 n=1 Tax=Fusarium agapanthi TaxID=1803897 RepID=A0A9P5EEY3_9HYPO|nr:Penicillin-binding 4 [Fusarium agapanthi]